MIGIAEKKIFVATALCLFVVTEVYGGRLRINIGGPSLSAIGFYNDFPEYLTSEANTAVVTSSATVDVAENLKPVYSTYRHAIKGNLEYKLPVPPGSSYKVFFMFVETEFITKAGSRKFGVFINGVQYLASLDVFARVGANKPFFLIFKEVSAPSGTLTITLKRISGSKNPMLSGLMIAGKSPGAIILRGRRSNKGPADPTCSTGIFGFNRVLGQMACCEKQCGKCGGSKCGSFSPGKSCCISTVYKTAPSCNVAPPPCVPSSIPPQSKPSTSPSQPPSNKPSCSTGKLGFDKKSGQYVCCSQSCSSCGGSPCATAALRALCCVPKILKSNKSCDDHGPPCILTKQKGAVVSPSPQPSTNDGSLCSTSGATKTSFRMNVAGGTIASASMGADNEDYVTSAQKGIVYSMPSAKISAPSGPKSWDEAYVSHRYTTAPSLIYSIPVPDGMYTVKVLFAETYFDKPNERLFDLHINGEEKVIGLDIFARVGMKKGLLMSYSNVVPVNGHITVGVYKVLENPMISGIMIEGKGAGDIAKGGSCTPSDQGGDNQGGNSEGQNGGFNHRAHAVPGGPYIGMDFEKKGFASVFLDGSSSHSHYSDPGPPPVSGMIVKFKWSWSVEENGKKITKMNENTSGKFSADFPLGVTAVTLEVTDNTGDVAVDSTTVEVKSSTENGAYCYFYDFQKEKYGSVPIGDKLDSEPKPLHGAAIGAINFDGEASLSDVKFASNSFAIRCVFFTDVKKSGTYSYVVEHNGPFKLYDGTQLVAESSSSGKSVSPKRKFTVGLHSFQLLYFRPISEAPKLKLLMDGEILPTTILQHDSSTTLPVIEKLSSSKSAPSGGGNIQIYGSGFVNGVSVKFGSVEALNLISSNPGTVQVTVPPGKGSVFITVSTNAGTSNAYPFSYTSESTLEQPVIFEKTLLTDKQGNKFSIPFAVDLKYGPDGRLYVATIKGELYALSVDENHNVISLCVRTLQKTEALLGIAFDPASPSLKMYFSVSVLYWMDYNILNFEEGWTNGKVKSIVWSSDHLEDGGGFSCAGNIEDVVTGLPVSNHDHGVNKLQFLTDGKLLISIGGFTNGGKSIPGKKPVPNDEPNDSLGGVASNPLSAAMIVCPTNKLTAVKYDNYADPEKAKVISGKECEIYATGLRNSFGMTLHTNGELYATDNGPNNNFGDFTKDCDGNTVSSKNIPDSLFRINKNKWHGHPNLNRKECVHFSLNPPSAVKPILSGIQSAVTGIVEYRSNTFGGVLKGSLLLSQFAGQNEGNMGQVVLENNGMSYKSFVPNFFWASGTSVAEGPRGEIAASRVYKGEIIFVTPKFPKPIVTFMLSVLPRNGPASGGVTVLISGFNFGKAPEATFGGKKCTNVIVMNDESFKCTTPSNKKGAQVPVVVTGSSGISPSYGNDYWYW